MKHSLNKTAVALAVSALVVQPALAANVKVTPLGGQDGGTLVWPDPGSDLHGAIEAQATKVAGNTTLANIIRMVRDAQSKRAPSEQWVEKFARIYTPVVLALAVAVLVIPPLFFGGAHETTAV